MLATLPPCAAKYPSVMNQVKEMIVAAGSAELEVPDWVSRDPTFMALGHEVAWQLQYYGGSDTTYTVVLTMKGDKTWNVSKEVNDVWCDGHFGDYL